MKFLIPTEPDDTHAILTKLALENIGHDVRMFYTADLPTKQKNSVFIDEAQYQWKSADIDDCISDNHYDVVWWRRARKPFIPKSQVHPQDYKFVVRENTLFYESLTYNMAPHAWWVNPKDAANRANSKLLQLKTAVDSGFKIPLTLCSNDPQDIRYFLLKHEAEGVIYKPLCSNFWFEEQQTKIAYTAKIGFLDLPSNSILQRSPGLFQKEVKKKYELRVTCFGDYLVAAKLHSQSHTEGLVDWRAIPEGKMRVEPYTLPSAIEKKIRTFMHKMGLVFGSLDLIVSTDNEYIFLEVNEQGQFLWLEEYNQDLKMLDIFVKFLTNGPWPFKWEATETEHTIEQYREEMSSLAIQSRQKHVDLNRASAQNL